MHRASSGLVRHPAQHRLLVGAATALALLLSACGAEPSATGDAEPTATSALPAAEGSTQYPLTLDSDAGEITLDERPERIAVVDTRPTATDVLLELGVTPVLAPEGFFYGGWTPQAAIDQIETIWEYGEDGLVSRELLLTTEPDLIVHYSNRTMDEQRATELNTIAPTLSFREQDVPWQELLVLLAEVVDLPTEGERVLDEVDDVVATARESLREHHGKTATISHVHADGRIVYVSRPGRDAATLLEDLGFALSPSGSEVPEDFVISMENIGLLDADFLYLSAFAEVDADPVVDSPLFQSLPVVAEGRTAYEFEDTSDSDVVVAWGLIVPGPRSIKAVVPLVAESANEVLSGS